MRTYQSQKPTHPHPMTREPDEDDRREAIRERRERFQGCKCGYPDMPGYCPGWRNCPMCEQDEEPAP